MSARSRYLDRTFDLESDNDLRYLIGEYISILESDLYHEKGEFKSAKKDAEERIYRSYMNEPDLGEIVCVMASEGRFTENNLLDWKGITGEVIGRKDDLVGVKVIHENKLITNYFHISEIKPTPDSIEKRTNDIEKKYESLIKWIETEIKISNDYLDHLKDDNPYQNEEYVIDNLMSRLTKKWRYREVFNYE